eukprot:766328-Hanusia_phi.AAC.4
MESRAIARRNSASPPVVGQLSLSVVLPPTHSLLHSVGLLTDAVTPSSGPSACSAMSLSACQAPHPNGPLTILANLDTLQLRSSCAERRQERASLTSSRSLGTGSELLSSSSCATSAANSDEQRAHLPLQQTHLVLGALDHATTL